MLTMLTMLHHAPQVMTLTTIGYGDVTPHTEGELVFAIFAMALGASTYAYLVGDVCGEIGNGDPLGVQFRQKMDCVKSFMEAHGLPEAMRHKLKVCVHSSLHAYTHYSFTLEGILAC
jgi:hypothetical protein